MGIEITDAVERIVSTLETQTSGTGEQLFPKIREAYYPTVKQIELELNLPGTMGTSGAAQPLPHTLASFTWYQPIASQTPLVQPYTYPVLRPICSGCLIEAFVEVGSAAIGGDVLLEFFKNNTKIAESTLTSGSTSALVTISGALSIREFTRDDFMAYKITEDTAQKARGLTVYLRFFQYPYIMADHQNPIPEPA